MEEEKRKGYCEVRGASRVFHDARRRRHGCHPLRPRHAASRSPGAARRVSGIVQAGLSIHPGAPVESEETPLVEPCRIRISRADCLSCAACPPVCHSGALQLRALDLEIDEALCDNCLLCVPTCPVGAIALVPETHSKNAPERNRPSDR
ncbi:MAG: 4Fe-4S binding protein [Chitinivibrionia bacterium]|nr:4Fe-4S binding protein [Chitinivibrionia bacterium]